MYRSVRLGRRRRGLFGERRVIITWTYAGNIRTPILGLRGRRRFEIEGGTAARLPVHRLVFGPHVAEQHGHVSGIVRSDARGIPVRNMWDGRFHRWRSWRRVACGSWVPAVFCCGDCADRGLLDYAHTQRGEKGARPSLLLPLRYVDAHMVVAALSSYGDCSSRSCGRKPAVGMVVGLAVVGRYTYRFARRLHYQYR